MPWWGLIGGTPHPGKPALGNVGCIVTSWLPVVGTSVPPTVEVASHLLALMGYIVLALKPWQWC